MGNTICGGSDNPTGNTTHTIHVKTGDKKGAGTDGNIFVSMADGSGKWCEERLIDTKWKNDFESGNVDVFHAEFPELGRIQEICIRRDQTCKSDAWFLETVKVEHRATKAVSIFPVIRWINADDKILLSEFDCSLPSDDKNPEQRKKELDKKREMYKLVEKVDGGPKQADTLPDDEKFSNEYKHDLDAMKLNLFVQTTWVKLTTSNFDTLDDFNGIYNKKLLPIPYGQQNWKSDEEFGNQRLSGCNPLLLKRCQQIPEKLAVTEEMIKPFLEGKSLEEALEKKKLYYVDLTYMCNIKIAQPEKYELCGPIALFYSNDRGELVPIAIQLMPEPADDNPVFLPSDPEYTWLAAKMWFNLSDSSHHQSVTHIGFTHFYMENVAACAHRQLSPSHPVFKLLAPHFLYLMAINSLGLARLVSVGGWVDTCMTVGVSGMFDIIKANWKEWDWSKAGNILKDFEFRGVDDKQALPNYHYRDDSTLLWHAIYKYVSNVINAYYDTKGKLTSDHEIQTWVREISESGVKGIPLSVSTNDELSELLTSFMFTASVGHAAANFCQYDEYAFPPNYPAKLTGKRPRNKEPLTEKYVLDCLASRKETLDVMIVTKLLSERATNELGDFEMQYAYDPIMLKALEQFKADLKVVGATIDKRNASRVRKYPYLHPKEIPNAISI